jgi:U3 small nucleolar RNA-associated protein MPP10
MEEDEGPELQNGNLAGKVDGLRKEEKESVAPEQLSNFEKRKRRIDENIEQVEEEALQPKAWQFQGEVTAQSRPENSLLEEHLIFDHLLRQAPEVTAETTLKLEDIIKQRIKDQAWDDVERKIKPIDDPFEYKKKLVLDAEKSKMSLSQIYEQEYIEKQKAEDGSEKMEEVPPEQLQIQKDLESLFAKLDALSNFHYTPKAPSAEIKVVSNLPSVSIEEVAPVSVSDATLLAPQEIQTQTKGEIKGKAERTETDRKRERRQKKKGQKLKRISREEKAKLKGLGLRNIKLAENISKSNKRKKSEDGIESFENSKELKSSKAFFAKLQNQVDTHIKQVVVKKKKLDASKLSPKKLKL